MSRITLVRVKITLLRDKSTLVSVEITLMRVLITLVHVKITLVIRRFMSKNCTLRLKITFVRALIPL
jgi:hypothetical protein